LIDHEAVEEACKCGAIQCTRGNIQSLYEVTPRLLVNIYRRFEDW